MSRSSVRVAAYVDGLNLYNGMHDARGRRGLWLDLEGMLTGLLGASRALVAVHYFTTVVTGPGGGRQQIYLHALEASGAVTTVHRGRFQRRQMVCRRCGSGWSSYEEKESDVSLAVRMVGDAALGVFDEAWLLSADSDLVPAVRATRRVTAASGRSVRVSALFPPHRSSQDLRREADSVRSIFDRVPERYQLADPVVTGGGERLWRPKYWR